MLAILVVVAIALAALAIALFITRHLVVIAITLAADYKRAPTASLPLAQKICKVTIHLSTVSFL
jgi:hypothetical protein